MLQSGHCLRVRYTIDRILGRGGMGSVYRALDATLGGKPVAIKEMRVEVDDPIEQARAQAQFAKEARILAGLDHPGLVAVTDYFEEDGRQYLVMSYVDGDTLEALLLQAVPPLDEVLGWLIDLCDVLGYLHAHNPPVVFRDLKPANVMRDKSGRLRLIDFGIARGFEAKTATFVKGLGTPGYAPLEQYGKGTSDPRSDIYALGATVYHLLTGAAPPASVDRIAVGEAVAPPSTRNTRVSPEVDAMVLKMLALQKADRFDSVHEVRAIVERVRNGAPPASRAPLQLQRAPQAAPQLAPPLPTTTALPAPRRFPGLPPAAAPVPVTPTGPLSISISLRAAVQSVAFAPNGGFVAAGLQDGRVAVVAVDSTEPVVPWLAHTASVPALAFLPDGTLLATASTDGSLCLWHAATLKLVRRFKFPSARFESMAFSPDGRWIATAWGDSKVPILEVQNGRTHAGVKMEEDVVALAFLRDSTRLAVACRDRRLYCVQLAERGGLRRGLGPLAAPEVLRGPGVLITSMALSADGRLLAVGSEDHRVHLYDGITLEPLASLPGHANTVSAVTFSRRDNLLASASWDRTVRLWDPQSHKCLRILRGHTDSVTNVAFSRASTRLASASWDGTVRLWDVSAYARRASDEL